MNMEYEKDVDDMVGITNEIAMYKQKLGKKILNFYHCHLNELLVFFLLNANSLYKVFHNSVVMTVFNIGILDLSCFLLITLSCTNQGEISSMLPCLLRLFVVLALFFRFLAVFPL